MFHLVQRCRSYMLCGLSQDLFLSVMQFFAKSSRTYSSIFILHQPTTRPKYSVSSYESALATPQAQRDHAAMKRKVLTKYRKQTTGSHVGRVETRSGLVLLTLHSILPSISDNYRKWGTEQGITVRYALSCLLSSVYITSVYSILTLYQLLAF